MDTVYYDSPIGLIEIQATSEAVTSLVFCNKQDKATNINPPVLERCLHQLDEYFQGQRTDFDIPIFQKGTVFQLKVWDILMDIPFGTTTSYASVAHSLGNANASRAVGTANGSNLVWIIVPCHRVIGADGSLTGYAGGIERKKWLLMHEAKVRERLGLAHEKSGQLKLF